MSPELVYNKIEYTQKVDIWALGILAIELVYGEPPNINQSHGQVLTKIVHNDSPKIQAKWSEEFQDFVAKCLDKNVDSRWTAAMLIEHPFMVGAEDLCGAWCYDIDHWLSSQEGYNTDNWQQT